MSSHVVFTDCDDPVKTELEAYWARKLPRLQKLLTPYPTDLQEIRLTVYCHQQSPLRWWHEVRADIQLPTGTLAAEADDRDPRVALDRVADTLAREIKRHKERVRKDYIYKRRKRARSDLSAAGPALQQQSETGRREDFFQLLRPLLRFLRDHARHELRILELEGGLHRGEVTVADLLGEVLTRAWQRFADRPRHLPLDLWLTELLHEVLHNWIKQEARPHLSLEERADKVVPDQVPQPDDEDWWADAMDEEETFRLEDLIPGSEGTEAWEKPEAEEQRDQVLSLLKELPVAQRQAFLLHALEDYSTDEIAMLQYRPESEVKADIEAARRTLRERLVASGQVREAGKPVAAAAHQG